MGGFASFSPLSHHLLAVTKSDRIFLFNTSSQELLSRLEEHKAAVSVLVPSPASNSQLISGGDDGLVVVWNVKSNPPAGGLYPGNARVVGISVLPSQFSDGSSAAFVAARADGSLTYHASRGDSRVIGSIQVDLPAPVTSFHASPSLLVVASANSRAIGLLSAKDPGEPSIIELPSGSGVVDIVAVDAFVLAATPEALVVHGPAFASTAVTAQVARPEGATSVLTQLEYNREAFPRFVFAGTSRGSVEVYSFAGSSLACLLSLDPPLDSGIPRSPVSALALIPTPRRWVIGFGLEPDPTGGDDSEEPQVGFGVWDLGPMSGQLVPNLIHAFAEPTNGVYSLAVDAVSSRIAVSDNEKVFQLYNVLPQGSPKLQLAHEYVPRAGGIRALLASPEAVVSGAFDGACYIYNRSSGDLLATCEKHKKGVRSLALCYTPGSSGTLLSEAILFSGGKEGDILGWDTGTGDLVVEARSAHDDEVMGLVVVSPPPDSSAERTLLYSCGIDGVVYVWEYAFSDVLERVGEHRNPVLASGVLDLAWSPSCPDLLYLGLGNDDIVSLNLDSGAFSSPFQVGSLVRARHDPNVEIDTGVESLVVDGSREGVPVVYSSGSDGRAYASHGLDGSVLCVFGNHKGLVRAVGYDHGSGLLFSGAIDDTIHVYRACSAVDDVLESGGGREGGEAGGGEDGFVVESWRDIDAHVSAVRSMDVEDGVVYSGSTTVYGTSIGVLSKLACEANVEYKPEGRGIAALAVVNRWKNVVGFFVAIALLAVEFFQLLGFAFGKAVNWGADDTQSAVQDVQTTGVETEDHLEGKYVGALVLVGVFFCVLALSEWIETSAFLFPNVPKFKYLWLVIGLFCKVTAGPLFFATTKVFFAVVEDAGSFHWVFVGLGLLLQAIYVGLAFRFVRVGADLAGIVFEKNPLDWSRDRVKVVRAHPLSNGPINASYAIGSTLIKVILVALSVFVGEESEPMSIALAVSGIFVLILSFVFPPFYSLHANSLRLGLDAGLTWAYTVAIIAINSAKNVTFLYVLAIGVVVVVAVITLIAYVVRVFLHKRQRVQDLGVDDVGVAPIEPPM